MADKNEEKKTPSELCAIPNSAPSLGSEAPPDGVSRVKTLLDLIGGETGMLGPLVKIINQLLEDPLLRKTLDDAPVPFHFKPLSPSDASDPDDHKKLH